MTDEFSLIQDIVRKYRGKKGALIPVLQEVQSGLGYLSEETLKTIAIQLNLKASEVFGVATFYAQFHFKPRGKKIIRVCRGTACHVRGGASILEEIKNELQVDEGETTEDGVFTLETVACIGACGLAPVITINEKVHGRLVPAKIKSILESHRNEVLTGSGVVE